MSEKGESNIKIAVVGLDLSPMDTILFAYMAQINKINKFEKIYFLHISKELELPEEVSENYPDLLAPLDESIAHDIEAKLKNYNWGKETKVIADVEEGNTIQEILHYAKVKESDLIVLGRKKTLKGSGVSVSRVARKSNCSILLVPEVLPEDIKRVLLTLDFGSTSERSYRVAENFTKKNTALSIIHLYHVPHGYSKTGKSYEEFDTIMLQNAEKDFERFTIDLKMKTLPDVNFVNGDNVDPEDVIMDYAHEINTDLIVIGSKGKSTSAFILLGSMAEKLLTVNNDIPMLIVKKKNENMSFLDALMKI